MKMKLFSTFFVLVFVFLAVSVTADKFQRAIAKTALKPTVKSQPIKPTAVARPGGPDRPERPDKKTTNIDVISTESSSTKTTIPSTTAGRTTTTPSSGRVSCSVDDPVFASMCANVTPKGGVVQSPNFPGDYGNDRNITVTIDVPAGKKILLKFTTFNLEMDEMYKYDWIHVYDGNTSVFLLNTVSGNIAPSAVTTKSSRMIINFISDSSNGRVASPAFNWQATFTALPVTTVPTTSTETTTQIKTTTVTTTSSTPSATTPSTSPITCSVTTAECGVMCVNLTSTGGEVQSPNFPGDYGDNRNCIITIVMPAKKKVQLRFTIFNLEAEAGSVKGFDYIDVLDVKAFVILLNGVTGNTIPSVVTTKNNKMMINFTSDRNNLIPSNVTYNWKATFTMI